ncbi:hypothetical protein J2S43_001476 [Catenuloplanes nepalensis]|uniref:Uncharacterized protein n=1 Tax=Catenuloplanes nepalensis TaxID=587533 RepID=A0ABT9MNJ7_9ACTN|nr:hypothetical protein [Catenuloplanes nepalensis]MDP9792964.1 hypothetical protein [Catenuloplanes nepalensis]
MSWETTEIGPRSDGSGSWRRSCPLTLTTPPPGSKNRSSSATTVLLPAPDRPTSAVVPPGAPVKVTSSSASAR